MGEPLAEVGARERQVGAPAPLAAEGRVVARGPHPYLAHERVSVMHEVESEWAGGTLHVPMLDPPFDESFDVTHGVVDDEVFVAMCGVRVGTVFSGIVFTDSSSFYPRRIIAAAKAGLISVDLQTAEGYLWTHPDVAPWGTDTQPEGWPKRIKNPEVRGYSEPLGEWTVEGVGRPAIFPLAEGRWMVRMSRSCNPYCFRVYIEESGSDLNAVFGRVLDRVQRGDWK